MWIAYWRKWKVSHALWWTRAADVPKHDQKAIGRDQMCKNNMSSCLAVGDFEHSDQRSHLIKKVHSKPLPKQMIHPTAPVTWRPGWILMLLGLFNIQHQMLPMTEQGCARGTDRRHTSCHRRRFKRNEMRRWEQRDWWLLSCYRAASLMNKTSAPLIVKGTISLTERFDAKIPIICTILIGQHIIPAHICSCTCGT